MFYNPSLGKGSFINYGTQKRGCFLRQNDCFTCIKYSMSQADPIFTDFTKFPPVYVGQKSLIFA